MSPIVPDWFGDDIKRSFSSSPLFGVGSLFATGNTKRNPEYLVLEEGPARPLHYRVGDSSDCDPVARKFVLTPTLERETRVCSVVVALVRTAHVVIGQYNS